MPPDVQDTERAEIFRNGGGLIPTEPVSGHGEIALGKPPRNVGKDWAVVVRRKR